MLGINIARWCIHDEHKCRPVISYFHEVRKRKAKRKLHCAKRKKNKFCNERVKQNHVDLVGDINSAVKKTKKQKWNEPLHPDGCIVSTETEREGPTSRENLGLEGAVAVSIDRVWRLRETTEEVPVRLVTSLHGGRDNLNVIGFEKRAHVEQNVNF